MVESHGCLCPAYISNIPQKKSHRVPTMNKEATLFVFDEDTRHGRVEASES